MVNQTSNSVEVFCLPGFDGGLPQHFVLEVYYGNSQIVKFNASSFTEPYFFLDNLEPDVMLKFIVCAENSKGRSREEILEVLLKDVEKRAGEFTIESDKIN